MLRAVHSRKGFLFFLWSGRDDASVKFARTWAMPSPDTFSVQPIAGLLDRVLAGCQIVVDPFARNATRGTITNDLNPDTQAQYHMDAVEFCEMLIRDGVAADAVIFDPPYSPRQVSEVYQRIGKTATQHDTQNARLYRKVKANLKWMLKSGGVAVACGWNSGGFGPGMLLEEVLLVPHGGAHNDTIVTVERKQQGSLNLEIP